MNIFELIIFLSFASAAYFTSRFVYVHAGWILAIIAFLVAFFAYFGLFIWLVKFFLRRPRKSKDRK